MQRPRDFRITARSFAIPVTLRELEIFDHYERRVSLWAELQKIPGVRDVDYNGHFGLYVFLTVDKEYDNDKTLYAISDVMNRLGSQQIYQIWQETSDDCWTMTTTDKVDKLKADGLIGMTAELILEFPARSLDEALDVYEETLAEYNE